MPDFSPSIYGSSNLYTAPQPVNQLTQLENLVGIRNQLYQGQIAQQQVAQQQIATQQAAAQIKAQQLMTQAQNTDPTTGAVTTDTNKWKSLCAQDPDCIPAMPFVYDTSSKLNAATQTGLNAQQQKTFASNQSVTAQLNPAMQNGSVVSPTQVQEAPQGFTTPLAQSRTNYNTISDNATHKEGQLAAYNEIINMNAQGALTGTRLADAYQFAARNDPFHVLTGATDNATRSQEIGKWMAQGMLQAGMPNTDAKLAEAQHGNLNEQQLPEAISDLAPFFKASVQGEQKKLGYYNQMTNYGSDMSKEPIAAQKLVDNYDPRWIEFDNLPAASATNTKRHDFLIKHPDMVTPEKQSQYNELQNMGIVKGQQKQAQGQ